MPVSVAKTAGFCFGVQRAVKLAFDLAEKKIPAVTLGPIIHNPQIVQQLEQRGVRPIQSLAQCVGGETVVIRSHGVPDSVYRELLERSIPYEDATCPFVKKIHGIVGEPKQDGRIFLIAGDRSHPEVEGIVGYCRNPYYVFQNDEELKKILSKFEERDRFSFCMVAQTTFHTGTWEKCVIIAKKQCTNLTIFDTICNATTKRQLEAVELAKHSDCMIVVGGKHSSNTTRLKEICERYCRTILVETAQELLQYTFERDLNVGVTAGASTPACIIKEVQETMSDLLQQGHEESFEELLNQSQISTHNGARVKGVVIGINNNEVLMDIGTKYAGYIPLHELTDDPFAKPEDIVKVGDEIEVIVVRLNDVEGTVVLSKKRVDAAAGLEKVMGAAETGEILEGTVVEVVNRGVIAVTNGVKVFIPASQATASRDEPLENLLKKKVRFTILETNPSRKRAVGSIRAVLKMEKKAAEDRFWETAEVGQTMKGVVKSLTSYGAFVDVGGVDGMIHISELSWSRIKHPSEVVNVGDEVTVYIKDLDPEKRKISLGYKKPEDNPWEILKRDYQVGSVVKVRIVSMTSFGAFAQILPGVDGLIHISQISNERINRPQDVLSVGQEVDAKITELDFDKKRISLSIKALLEDNELGAQMEQPAENDAVEE